MSYLVVPVLIFAAVLGGAGVGWLLAWLFPRQASDEGKDND